MKITKHQQLSTIVDATLEAFNQIGTFIIEDEKELEVWVSYVELNRWAINLRWVENFTENKDGDDVPIYDRQIIYVNVNANSRKVIKDLLCELESIAEKPCPELVEVDTFDELSADEKRKS